MVVCVHDRKLISALAIAVLSLLGAAGECIGYDRWSNANTVKRRTQFVVSAGVDAVSPSSQLAQGSDSPLDGEVREHARGTAGVQRNLRRDLMPANEGMHETRRGRTRCRNPTPGRRPDVARARPAILIVVTLRTQHVTRSTGRISGALANRMGGTDRSTSPRSAERSTSPQSVFHIPGMHVPLHRNTHQADGLRRSETRAPIPHRTAHGPK